MKSDSHPLACQHLGRGHLFLRFGNPIKLGTSLRHKTDIPILGSKQRLNLQGQHEGLAGKGRPPTDSCLGAHSFFPEARHTLAEPGVQETIQAFT